MKGTDEPKIKRYNSYEKLRSRERFRIHLHPNASGKFSSCQEQRQPQKCKTPQKATVYFSQQLPRNLM